MRKIIFTLLCACCFISLIFGLTGCNDIHAHNYVEEIISPTCTEQGYTTYTCSCGEGYTDDYINPIGHVFSEYVYNNDATCFCNGTETAICSRENCGKSDTKEKENTALEHSLGEVVYVWNGDECTAKRVCTRNCFYEESETVNAEYVKDTDATCEINEKGHYVATFITNALFEKQITDNNSVEKEDSKLGHNFVNYIYNDDANCVNNGTETSICSRENCGKYDTKEKENTALSHNFGNISYVWNGDECTATRVCSRDSSHTETITVVGEYVKDTDATCTVNEKGHFVASFTNTIYSQQETAKNSAEKKDSAKGHTDGEWIVDKEALCSSTGSKHLICSVCKVTIKNETTPELGHDTIKYNAKNPTCIDIGWNAYEICSRCSYSTYKELSAKGHTNGEWIIDKAATCIIAGSKHQSCSVCKVTIKNETIPELGHDTIKYNAKAPTCTDLGWNAYETCSRCSYSTYKELSAKGHSDGEWIIDNAATCTTTGSKHQICANCSITLKNEIISPTGHSESVWVVDKQSTCKKVGSKHKECPACHFIFETESIPALQHSYTNNICTLCNQHIPSSGLIFELNEAKTYYIVKSVGSCTDSHIIIPDYYEGLPVREIADNAFNNCTTLIYITVGDELSHISSTAFLGCSKLKKTSYDNATYIGNESNPYLILFASKADWIGSCTIHSDTKIICQLAFYDNYNLTTITMSNNVTSIGRECFKDCQKLSKINLSSKLRFIEMYAFQNCYKLTNITIPSTIQFIGNNSFFSCNTLKRVEIQDTNIKLDYKCIIGSGAFNNCPALESVILGNNIGEIESGAFYYCENLTSLSIPQSVEKMSIEAITSCNSFRSIYIESIADWCNIDFYGNYDSWSRVSYDIYLNGSLLREVEIPYGVKTVKYAAFLSCTSITKVVLPDTVQTIENMAFYNCYKLTDLVVSKNLQSIGMNALYGCKIENLVLPEGIKSINYGTFEGLSYLKNITLPNSLIEIGGRAFAGCSSLVTVDIPSSVQYIGYAAFSGCTSLENIKLKEGLSRIGSEAFKGCSSLKTVSIPKSVTCIEDSAFENCSNLTSILLYDTLQSIGQNAFKNCNKLNTSTYKNGLYLGVTGNPYYFFLCPTSLSLTSFEFNSQTKVICEYAFYYCNKLTSITIPDNVIRLNDYAFAECQKLRTVKIGNGLHRIGDGAFRDCPELYSVTIGNNVNTIGLQAFMDCSSLSSVTFGTNVTYIEANAFNGCNFSSIVIPDSVVSIGAGAWADNYPLTMVIIGDNVEFIGANAFRIISKNVSTGTVSFPAGSWYISTQENATTGQTISTSDIFNNGYYLRDIYSSYNWHRK